MDVASNKPDEFQRLLEAFLDDQIDAQQHAQFTALLREDDEARDRYLESLQMDNSLRYWAGIEGALQRRSGELPTRRGLQESRAHNAGNNRRSSKNFYYLSASVAAACLTIGWYLGASQVVPSGLSQPRDGRESAELTRSGLNIAGQVVRFSADSEWIESDLAVMKGTYLRPGQCLELRRGMAEIQLSNGGRAILAGPASIEIQSGDEAYLRKGNATFVSHYATHGLTLNTPSSRCVLHDSQVGTTVDDRGAANVQVLDGETRVSLLDRTGDVVEERSLAAGAAARFDASTELISKIAYDDTRYVRRVHESFIAYRNFAGLEGNQEFEGTLGMDFVVKDPILVTKLGVFDSEADGLKRPLKAAIWARDEARSAYRFDDDFGAGVVAEMEFTPEAPGVLVQSNRLKTLMHAVALRPGAYTIVASGYGKTEPNGNEGDYFYDHDSDTARLLPAPGLRWRGESLPVNSLKRLDDGRGAILFVGCARWDTHVGEFPRVVDGGAVNRFRAGTFEFERLDNLDLLETNPRAPRLRIPESQTPAGDNENQDSTI